MSDIVELDNVALDNVALDNIALDNVEDDGIPNIQEVSSIRRGRINMIYKNDSNVVKYCMMPQHFFSDIEPDKAVDKVFKVLDLPKPEMIFQSPKNNILTEYFTHDSPQSLNFDFKSVYEKFLKDKIKKLNKGKRNEIMQELYELSGGHRDMNLPWTESLNQIIRTIYSNDKHMLYSEPINPVKDEPPDKKVEVSPLQSIRSKLNLLEEVAKEEVPFEQKPQPLQHEGECVMYNRVLHDALNDTDYDSEEDIFVKERGEVGTTTIMTESEDQHDDTAGTIHYVQKSNDDTEVSKQNVDVTEELLIRKINSLEHHRNLVEERMRNIISGLTNACQQANAYLWLHPQYEDKLGTFISKNALHNTTILSDSVISSHNILDDSSEQYHGHSLTLKGLFRQFPSTSRDTILHNPWNMVTKSFYETLYQHSKPYDADESLENIELFDYDVFHEIKVLEEKCQKISKEMTQEWKQKMNNVPKWKKCMDGKREWLLHTNDIQQEVHALEFKQILKPKISHIIYWSDKNDAIIWKKYIQERFPLGLFLIGSRTQGYVEALECMKHNRPLFVFNHTGGSASIVSKMIHFMKKNNFERPQDDKVVQYLKPEERFTHPSKFYYLNSNHFIKIQNMSRVMLQNWPDPFNADSLLVIDTLHDSIENIQNNVTKNMNSLFDDFQELGGKREDEMRLTQAWVKYHMLKKNAKCLYRKANIYIYLMAFMSFATTVVASLAEYLNNHWLAIASVALPIVTGIFVTIMYTFKPINKWAVCESSSRLILAEIYKFRTRTGIYRVSRKMGNTNNKDEHKRARKLFSEELIKVWQNIELSEMKLGSFSMTNIDKRSVNKIIKRVQDEEQNAYKKSKHLYQNFYNIMDETIDESNVFPYERMAIETYVKTRLHSIVQKHKRRGPILERSVQILQIIIFIITASGAFLSHLGYVYWVPLTMSFSATIVTIMEQKQLIFRLSSTNTVLIQMEQLLCYWQGLSIIERRKHSNATFIVETAENAILNELSGYIQAIRSTNNEDRD